MSNKSPEKLKSWLDKLQQESWQLELILTGFAIFLILGLQEPIDDLLRKAISVSLASSKFAFIFIWVGTAKLVWFIIITNLVIHLFLRSLWISTIGLRYVSEGIDLQHLKLAPVFKRFLQKNIKDFDHYIESLEKVCSTIFAFTFLIIFVILSATLFYLSVYVFGIVVLDRLEGWLGQVGQIISTMVNSAFTIGALLYFVDFVSLGWIKSIKWFARIYYPIYRFFSWITLSSLYRPLYYNLIDNRFGRWVGLLIVPYLILALVVSSVNIEYGKYLPKGSTPYELNTNRYDDTAVFKGFNSPEMFFGSIPSKYVDNDFLEVFLPYNGALDNAALEQICPDIDPAKRERVVLKGIISLDFAKPLEYNIDTLMSCFQGLYRLSIDDSTYTNQDWMLYQHPNRDIVGLLAIINISHLPKGAHQLKIERFGRNIFDRESVNKIEWIDPEYIPFWKTTGQQVVKEPVPSDSR